VAVTISSSNANVARVKATAGSAPAASITITIPQGTTSGNFIVQTSAVNSQKSPTIKATAGGVSKSAHLTVTP
jgi:uncharacterized membrane protein